MSIINKKLPSRFFRYQASLVISRQRIRKSGKPGIRKFYRRKHRIIAHNVSLGTNLNRPLTDPRKTSYVGVEDVIARPIFKQHRGLRYKLHGAYVSRVIHVSLPNYFEINPHGNLSQDRIVHLLKKFKKRKKHHAHSIHRR